jgi:hypothetical protein
MAKDDGIQAIAYAEVAEWFTCRTPQVEVRKLRDAYVERRADPNQRPVADAVVALADRELGRRLDEGPGASVDA